MNAPERCVVCGSSDLVEIHPAEIERIEDVAFSYSFSPEHARTFRLVRCRSCTHQFCAPLPEGIVSSYEDVVDHEYLRHAVPRRLAAAQVLRTVERFAPIGTLLDIGCATGDFLVAARDRGFAVEGLELSTWSSDIARDRGFLVHREALATLAARVTARYDVISLIGVIEHFPDPSAEMSRVARLLKPGGLVVLWTGDVDSIVARFLGRRWWYWQGQHIQYFTHQSLRRLVTLSGLEHVATTRYPFAANRATLENSLRRYRIHRMLSAALRPLFLVSPVIYLPLPGEMLFLARRPR